MTDHADTIRRAIMVSLSVTGDAYTHDEYDAAHASLGALLAERKQAQEKAEELGWMLEGCDLACTKLRAERQRAINDKNATELERNVAQRELEQAIDERDELRTALEISAPYVDQKSERGQAAYIVVQSALGSETMRRLGLRVFS